MALDLALVGAVVLFGVSGLASGAIRQLTHWTGFVCGALAAGPLAARTTPLLAPRLNLPAAGVRVVLSGLLFSVVAGVGAHLAHGALQRLSGGGEGGRVDRTAGFGLGAAKGGALLYAGLSLLLFFEKPLVRIFGKPPQAAADSRVLALVRGHNLFDEFHFAAAAKLERLAQAASDPRGAGALAGDPKLKALLGDPALKSALQDPALAGALRSGDLSALSADPKLRALLEDPRLADATH
jgi:uncharacterized membrane protein required for colicin V production